MSGPYRDPPELVETPEPRPYVVLHVYMEEILFLDHIERVRCRPYPGAHDTWELVVHLRGRDNPLTYTYQAPDAKKKALEAMKGVAKAKQRWEEHLARLSSTTIVERTGEV